MEVDHKLADSENGGSKRSRDEPEEFVEKRAKLDDEKSVEDNNDGKMDESGGAVIGPKKFGSSVEMFDYFFKIIHSWPTNLNLNKYEHIVLLELLKKGHLEAERKIGKGVKAFQVRFHPQYKSRCFFLIRDDESIEDFSFRKCVDHILPLPENMQLNKSFHGKGGGRGRGRGRGRGGK
ncbi:hypothetical protein RD792_005515 [Penstemon davidsonii]|uniref:Uncharacterized protein n=1 Tax=Penstemon davidsonii TaxID=160366 RepID=A0ABR0DEZ1_9LAMI|nr:hypothetical protein RD792_008179 [Penstemon davidsonii]KAK4487797.1 hypothetical protein RD792_005515 [Penstemon davidsonii]